MPTRDRPGLFWPLVIIGAGALLLLDNLGWLPAGWWAALRQLWPVLIILLGLDMLLGRRTPVRVSAVLLLGGPQSVEEIRTVNDRWHDVIYRASGSPRLYAMINSVIAASPSDSFSIPGRGELSVREHDHLLVALRYRNPHLASRLMEAHLMSAVASFLKAREQSSLQGRLA